MRKEELNLTETNSLTNFNWDENINTSEIFGEDSFGEPEEVTEEVEEEVENEEVEEDISEEIKNKTLETTIYDDVYKDLKDYGILKHVNIEEDEQLTPERLQELYEQDYDEEVNARINNWANNELDEEAKAFIKFKRSGGKTKDFLQVYSNTSDLPEGDIEDENFQDEIIRYQLRKEDYDHDEIEDVLETLTNNGKKKQRASRYYEKIEKQIEAEREELLNKQEEAKKQAILQEQSFRNGIKETLTSNKSINGFKIADKEKNQLFDFLTKKSIKVNNNYSVTPFQKKLSEVFQDTNKLVVLAKILNSDFDFKDFKKQVETETTRKVKSNLENRKGLVNSSVGSSTKGLNLSDIFS